MRILIVGAGVVGSNLASELSAAGHVVSVVDDDTTLVHELNERLDVLAIQGNGAQPSVLRKAGIEDSQMVIAVTNIDEVNLVICMLAARFGVQHKIARIRNEEYAGPNATLKPSELGIDTIINPEYILTGKLLRILDTPGATDCALFAEGHVQLVTFDINEESPIAGVKLKDVRAMAKAYSFLVAAIFRGDESLVPRGDDEIRAGDHIAVIANADTVQLILPLMQKQVQRVERVVIYGADMVGRNVAQMLQDRLERVVLIEPRTREAQRAATSLLGTLVLNGKATDPDVLREADLEHCDYFLALSDNDQDNLLAALVARHAGARHTALIARDPHFMPVLSSIGMEVVLNPRLATVGAILTHIRRGQIHVVTRIKESEAEVIELEADKGSKITKRPLKELDLPDGALVVAALRDDEMQIPDGNFQVRPGETVLVFALPQAIEKIERLFAKRRLFAR
jgi:trk system potassium uptake protein TrkA